MASTPLRYKRLIRAIPKHKTAQGALLEAGFSKETARTKAKRTLQAALRHEAREVLNASPNALQNSKALMNDIVGISREDLFLLLRKIANQDKDYGSALKVLAPLSKEHGVILSADDDQKSVTVPILNVVVDKTPAIDVPQMVEPLENGSVEP